MAKEILCAYVVDADVVAGWLGSYGGEDSSLDISRGMFSGEVGTPRWSSCSGASASAPLMTDARSAPLRPTPGSVSTTPRMTPRGVTHSDLTKALAVVGKEMLEPRPTTCNCA